MGGLYPIRPAQGPVASRFRLPDDRALYARVGWEACLARTLRAGYSGIFPVAARPSISTITWWDAVQLAGTPRRRLSRRWSVRTGLAVRRRSDDRRRSHEIRTPGTRAYCAHRRVNVLHRQRLTMMSRMLGAKRIANRAAGFQHFSPDRAAGREGGIRSARPSRQVPAIRRLLQER